MKKTNLQKLAHIRLQNHSAKRIIAQAIDEIQLLRQRYQQIDERRGVLVRHLFAIDKTLRSSYACEEKMRDIKGVCQSYFG